jgi:predicted outer membrane protein
MENKLSNQYVKIALAMVHLDVPENVAGLIQDTIHELIKKGEDFDLMTARSLYVKHQDTYVAVNELKAQYRILSELYEPKSKHKTQKKIGIMLDRIIKKLKN